MARGGGIAALDLIFSGGVHVPTVTASPELLRVRDLPRREEDPELAQVLTEALRTPSGTMELFPIQAQALADLHDHGGLLGSIGVGHGKTLITFLAPVVMESRHPVLLVPAKLVRKTERDFRELAKHWTAPGAGIDPSPDAIRIVSYERLGRAGGECLIEGADLLMADECHRLKNPRAACTRRFLRYCGEHPEVPVLALSGTITSRSLLDFHHLLRVTHGAALMPLPVGRHEVVTWAQATDEKPSERAAPGALRYFLTPDTPPTLPNVREGLGRRIFDTPGCVRTVDEHVPASIYVTEIDPPPHPDVLPYLDMLDQDEAPNGDALGLADRYRFTRSLVLGFFHEWDPPPPLEWLDRRRAWSRIVQDVLDQELPGLDSPLMVANAVDAGEIPGVGVLEAWRKIKLAFEPISVPRWITLDPLREIAASVKAPTLVWVEHVAVGEKLAEITGWTYYRQRGLSSDGRFVDDDPGNEPIILSIASNCEGRNLQTWSRNYIVTPPPKGAILEQLLGRTHRTGQLADTVEVTVRLGHPDVRATWRQSIHDAKRQQAMTGQPQKILLADLDTGDRT